MKAIKLLCLVLALVVVVLAFAACEDKKETEVSSGETSEEIVTPVEEENNYERIANPVVQYDSVEEAVQVVGHLCPIPTIYSRYNQKASVIHNTLIQIDFSDDSGDVLTIREERRPSGDISGIYNTYAYNGTVQIDGNDVDVKGDSEDSIVLVNWNDGAYSHSIIYANGGHSLDEVKAVVAEING